MDRFSTRLVDHFSLDKYKIKKREHLIQWFRRKNYGIEMRIFLNMGLTEHTGHGIPTIVEKYGKDVFEIESNYIRCTIPFEKEVIDQIDNKKVGLKVGLNKTEKKVIELLIENPSLTSIELAEKTGVTKRTIERAFKSLQEKKMIERIGSKRDGNWIVVG